MTKLGIPKHDGRGRGDDRGEERLSRLFAGAHVDDAPEEEHGEDEDDGEERSHRAVGVLFKVLRKQRLCCLYYVLNIDRHVPKFGVCTASNAGTRKNEP